MTVNYLPGQDITLSNADIIVNTVNCVSVMGKGVALSFKNRFGDTVMRPYRSACANRLLRPGMTILFPLPNGRRWAAMATKDHWRDSSKLEWVATSLDQLAAAAQRAGVKSIAIPPPGCGNGGLDWRIVEPMVLSSLSFLDRLDIHARSTIG